MQPGFTRARDTRRGAQLRATRRNRQAESVEISNLAVDCGGRSAEKGPMPKPDPPGCRSSLCRRTSLKIDQLPEIAEFESTPGDIEQIEQGARGGVRIT